MCLQYFQIIIYGKKLKNNMYEILLMPLAPSTRQYYKRFHWKVYQVALKLVICSFHVLYTYLKCKPDRKFSIDMDCLTLLCSLSTQPLMQVFKKLVDSCLQWVQNCWALNHLNTCCLYHTWTTCTAVRSVSELVIPVTWPLKCQV